MIRRVPIRILPGASKVVLRAERCVSLRAWQAVQLQRSIVTSTPRYDDSKATTPTTAAPASTEGGKVQVPAPTDLLEVYRALVASGRLKWDDEQVRVVMRVSDTDPTSQSYTNRHLSHTPMTS